jgi:hypothetical protein
MVGSNDKITYLNEFGEYTVMSIKDGSAYPSIDQHTSKLYLLLYPFGLNTALPQQRIATINNFKKDQDLSDKKCTFKIILLRYLITFSIQSTAELMAQAFGNASF